VLTGVEASDDGPTLGEVAQLTERAQVPQEPGGVVRILQAKDGGDQLVDVVGAPVIHRFRGPCTGSAGWPFADLVTAPVVLACYYASVSPRETSTFVILPAIDLRGGKVVRLRQGDFAREQVYAQDPVAIAGQFAAAGAEWIHVVDLDGARAGERRQASTIAAIIASFDERRPRLQVAGGLRTGTDISDVLGAGVDRVVVGTAALVDPAFVCGAIERHGPERIAIALDIRDGRAVGDGWISDAAALPVSDALARLAAVGATTVAVTAIERDGLLGGPDLALLDLCVNRTGAAILASGGIRSIADLEAVRRLGCAGAIVGRALYDGSLDLSVAIDSIANRRPVPSE